MPNTRMLFGDAKVTCDGKGLLSALLWVTSADVILHSFESGPQDQIVDRRVRYVDTEIVYHHTLCNVIYLLNMSGRKGA